MFSEGSLVPILQKFGLPENQPHRQIWSKWIGFVLPTRATSERVQIFPYEHRWYNVLELTQQGIEDREEAINNNGMALLREALGRVVSAGLLRQAESVRVG